MLEERETLKFHSSCRKQNVNTIRSIDLILEMLTYNTASCLRVNWREKAHKSCMATYVLYEVKMMDVLVFM